MFAVDFDCESIALVEFVAAAAAVGVKKVEKFVNVNVQQLTCVYDEVVFAFVVAAVYPDV